MNKSASVVRFMLENATTPEEAAHLASLLPEHELISSKPRVPYPSAWTLARQKESVKVAVYAVERCVDPDTLDACVAKANRLAVLEALAASKYLSEASRAKLEVKTKKWHDQAHVSFVKALPARFAAVMAQYRAPYGLTDVGQFLENPAIPVEFVEVAIDLLLAPERLGPSGDVSVVVSLLASFTGVTDTPYYQNFWKRSSRTLSDLWGMVEDASLKDRALLHLVSLTTDNYFSKSSTDLIGREICEQMLAALEKAPSSLPKACAHAPKVRNVFSTEAIDLILSRPAMVSLLTYQCLSPDQMSRLIALVPQTKRAALLYMISGSEELAELIYDSFASSTRVDDYSVTKQVLDSLSSIEGPLVQKLVAHADETRLLDYMTKKWSVPATGQILYPAPGDLPALLKRFPSPLPDQAAAPLRSFVSSMRHRDPLADDYLRAFIDQVPGAAAGALDASACGAYIHQRLLSTSASPEVILDQLTLAPTVSLNHMCDVLTAMARMSAQ